MDMPSPPSSPPPPPMPLYWPLPVIDIFRPMGMIMPVFNVEQINGDPLPILMPPPLPPPPFHPFEQVGREQPVPHMLMPPRAPVAHMVVPPREHVPHMLVPPRDPVPHLVVQPREPVPHVMIPPRDPIPHMIVQPREPAHQMIPPLEPFLWEPIPIMPPFNFDIIQREHPNILITGASASGKSTIIRMLLRDRRIYWLDMAKILSRFHKRCSEESDMRMSAVDLHRKMMKSINKFVKKRPQGGIIFEHRIPLTIHPKWIDCIVILKTDPQVLNNRLWRKGVPAVDREILLRHENMNVSLVQSVTNYLDKQIEIFDNTHQNQIPYITESIQDLVDSWPAAE